MPGAGMFFIYIFFLAIGVFIFSLLYTLSDISFQEIKRKSDETEWFDNS
jgi:hypothetical protein